MRKTKEVLRLRFELGLLAQRQIARSCGMGLGTVHEYLERAVAAGIGWQKWLFGFGIAFTAIALTSEISFQGGRIKEFHFLMRDFPAQFGSFAVLAIACWIGYYSLRHRLRTPKPTSE